MNKRLILFLFVLALSLLTSSRILAQDIDTTILDAIPPQSSILLEDAKLVIDDRSTDDTGLIYWTHDLPPGLRYDANTKTIAGRPTQTGTFTFQIILTDDPNDPSPIIREIEWAVELPKFEQIDPHHSVARIWNETALNAIRKDTARPTVHARNLFHTSAAMYDAWTLFDATATPYLVDTPDCKLNSNITNRVENIESARHEIISYTAYTLLSHRFQNSPGRALTVPRLEDTLTQLGYTKDSGGELADLGRQIAQCYIDYGLSDLSNEQNDYASLFYEPINRPIPIEFPIRDLRTDLSPVLMINRWMPLAFDVFIGQGNFASTNATPEFVSPEWGKVKPFALSEEDLTIYDDPRNEDNPYWVYHDPGEPPKLRSDRHDEAVWGFMLVPQWASYLDPADGVTIDISPASVGNNTEYKNEFSFLQDFYSAEGGDNSPGHPLNPHTGQPYEENSVLRADYGRVIAEYWADGPDSETPPGHWYTILNTVSDNPDLVKKYRGEGDVLSDLEWDIKAYFALGGAMHDSAVSAWGAKGYYDYGRPVSVIRLMTYFAQQDLNHPLAIPLSDDFIRPIPDDDPSIRDDLNRLGKLEIRTWKGPDFIKDPETDVAGVDWILAENWWPYQRPTFVTPPFAGYVSGHSTFSRAAAETLTALTGDAYFPGGMGEFVAEQNEFLVFEEGPSQDVVLQWATYQDAADQSAISRIYGGIHPPADDMPGRIMGETIGKDAFVYADAHFSGDISKSSQANYLHIAQIAFQLLLGAITLTALAIGANYLFGNRKQVG